MHISFYNLGQLVLRELICPVRSQTSYSIVRGELSTNSICIALEVQLRIQA